MLASQGVCGELPKRFVLLGVSHLALRKEPSKKERVHQGQFLPDEPVLRLLLFS
jgi:hypothetical protein